MSQVSQSSRWPLPIRIAVLFVIFAYLVIMIWAPLTTPVGAPHLTTPVETVIAPVQHALFLRHGYRFFAPDPGPTHALVYEIENADGTKTEGHFPDRDNTVPRLLYHRWFMLSETLYREASQLPAEQQFVAQLKRYETQIAAFEKEGKTELSQRLTADRDQEMAQLERAKSRCESMLRATARVLLNRFRESENTNSEPKSIRLWIQTRDQPTAEESIDGMELTDPILMSRVEVRFYQVDELVAATVPETESIAPLEGSVGGDDE
jgi:hypothetical protein